VNDGKHKVKSLIRETLNMHDKELTALINELLYKSKKNRKFPSTNNNQKNDSIIIN